MSEFDQRDRRDARVFPLHFKGGKWSFHQPCLNDRLRYMARSGGYVMVRNPRAFPFVVSEKEWARFPLWSAPLTDDGEAGKGKVK